jgi:glutaconate CoA-transferase subunit A
MSKLTDMRTAVAAHIPDGSSVALGLQMEQMIPFSTAHEIIRQQKRNLTLIGPISDCLFDQLIGAGCVEKVIAAWVGNVMMGSAYNFRRAVEERNPGAPPRSEGGAAESDKLRVFNLTNFSVALALQAGAMGVPFLPTRSAQGSDIPKGNHFYYQIFSPFEGPGERTASPGPGEPGARAQHEVAKPLKMEPLLAVRAIVPDVTIAHVQRADEDGNAHCWGNFGVLLEGVRAAKKVIVVAEEIVSREVIASDPNRTIIPGFLASAVVHSPLGAHPSPVQGYYKRDDDFFAQYHKDSKTAEDYARYRAKWIEGVKDVREYAELLGKERVASLGVKKHAYAAPVDYGY